MNHSDILLDIASKKKLEDEIIDKAKNEEINEYLRNNLKLKLIPGGFYPDLVLELDGEIISSILLEV